LVLANIIYYKCAEVVLIERRIEIKIYATFSGSKVTKGDLGVLCLLLFRKLCQNNQFFIFRVQQIENI